jgi:tripartite ATP-independent transporter DctM subunit
MEWWLVLAIIFGSFLLLVATGMPVAFCFLVVNIIGMSLLVGPQAILLQLSHNSLDILTTFTLLPMVLFILMGEVAFHSGIAIEVIDAVEQWLGKLPGRLSLLAVASGTVLSTLTGVSMASTAILGSTLVPDMERRGYKKAMSIGPVLGSGGLAIMIPPSGMSILIGVLGEVSIGRILMAIILPGLLMATLYATYIIVRCSIQPSLAPPYTLRQVPIVQKLTSTARYALPVVIIFFCVVGLIFLGVATPSEAAATGTLASFLVAAAYRKLNMEKLKKIISGATVISVMVMMIILSSKVYSQLLAYSGATRELVEFIAGLGLSPLLILVVLQIVPLILGMFMGATAVVMLTVPLVMPLVITTGINPVLYSVTLLLCVEMGTTSPPYGLSLFVMKSVAPPDTTMGDCYRGALPFLGCDLIALIFIMVFPAIALWLPSSMF